MTCPYTWFKSLLSSSHSPAENSNKPASNLHVRVIKQGQETVRVALPAQSARWLMELIPSEVVDKIRAEKIPLDEVLNDLKTQEVLHRRNIFSLHEEHRQVDVWLE